MKDGQLDLHSIFQGRNFRGLMTLYESNYARLLKLVPDIHHLDQPLVSRVPGALDLHVQVLERSKYTTILSMTYLFEEAEGPVADPDLRIRLFHDARVAEVLSCCRRHKWPGFPEFRGSCFAVLDRKWEINHFLDRWLSYCQAQGHSFHSVSRRDPAPALADS